MENTGTQRTVNQLIRERAELKYRYSFTGRLRRREPRAVAIASVGAACLTIGLSVLVVKNFKHFNSAFAWWEKALMSLGVGVAYLAVHRTFDSALPSP
jgi:hypothetical protein